MIDYKQINNKITPVCYAGTIVLISLKIPNHFHTVGIHQQLIQKGFFFKFLSKCFILDSIEKFFCFKNINTSHNSSILHKQSHALLCSSFEQCIDFYNMTKIRGNLKFENVTRISKILLSNGDESKSCSSNAWILIHDEKHFKIPINNDS